MPWTPPTQGTFVLKPVSVNQNQGYACQINNGFIAAPTNAELIEAATTIPGGLFAGWNVGAGVAGTINLNFSVLGLGLYLDGSLTPTDTNNLPVGFTVNNCSVMCGLSSISATPGEFISLTRNGSVIATAVANGGEQDFEVELGAITNLALVTSIIGFRMNNGGVYNHWEGYELRIEGTYAAGSITLSPSGGEVESGQRIRINADGIEMGALVMGVVRGNKVIRVPIRTTPPSFEIPYPADPDCFACFGDCPTCEDCVTVCEEDLDGEACQACLDACLECLSECLEGLQLAEDCLGTTGEEPDEVEITVIVADTGGNVFTGSVVLGEFTVLLTRGSGIYQFVEGKTNDTLYSSERDGSTYDVKIPNPGGKTGFFRD